MGWLGWFLLANPGRLHALTADDYESTLIEGWTVRVEKSLADHPRRAEALGLLQSKLRQIRRVLPRRTLPKLRQVTIWLSRDVARARPTIRRRTGSPRTVASWKWRARSNS